MTDFPNLRSNFQHVIEHARLRDIETMLRVIGNELGPRFHDASLLTYEAAEALSAYRHGKRGPRTVARDRVPGMDLGQVVDEGGESG